MLGVIKPAGTRKRSPHQFDGRLAQLEAKFDARLGQLEAKSDTRMGQLEANLETRLAQMQNKILGAQVALFVLLGVAIYFK